MLQLIAAQTCLASLCRLAQSVRGVAAESIRALSTSCPASTSASTSSSLDGNSTLKLACLNKRAVISLAGSESATFLQGLVTNDTRPLEKEGSQPVYAGFLTAKGKLLHDVFIGRGTIGEEPSLLVEVDAQGKKSLLDWLVRYRLRRNIKIEDVSSHYQSWALFGAGTASLEDKINSEGGEWHRDPRLGALGLRAVLSTSSNSPPEVQLEVATGTQPEVVAEEVYCSWRYMYGVAEGEDEMTSGKTAPLEYNLDVLNGVSYQKGCYVGQERSSYTHFRGVIRRRAMPAILAPKPSISLIGSNIVVCDTQEVVGTVRATGSPRSLIHIKLSAAIPAAAGHLKLKVQQEGLIGHVDVKPIRPDWWPSEWGHEEGGD